MSLSRRMLMAAAASAGGGGGGGFSPSDVANLVGWYDADAITGLSNGDPVSAWEDKSAQAHDTAQATSGNQPIYVTGLLNGMPGVRFVSNDWLQLDDALGISTTMSMFAVVHTRVTTQQEWLHVGDTSGDGIGFMAYNGNRSILVAGITIKQDGAINTAAAELWTMRHGTATDFRVNATSTSVTNSTTDPNAPSARFTIGGNYGAGAYGGSSDVDLFEIVIYAAEVSTTDRDSIQTYLMDKWGL